MYHKNQYYILSQQRISYMCDRAVDERFFILTLFTIAMEVKDKVLDQNTILNVEIPVGLPLKHYGALYSKFEEYILNRGVQSFVYKGKTLQVEISNAMAFPQDYAATMIRYKEIKDYTKVITVDIGGVILDYMLICNNQSDMSVCDSLEKGVISMYNRIISRIRNEHDTLLEGPDIDSIIQNKKLIMMKMLFVL